MNTPSQRIRAALDRATMNRALRVSASGVSSRPTIVVVEEHLSALLQSQAAPRTRSPEAAKWFNVHLLHPRT